MKDAKEKLKTPEDIQEEAKKPVPPASFQVVAVTQPKEIREWSQEEIQLVKNTVAVGTTDLELKLFLYTAKQVGLNPLTRQIHCVKRKRWNSGANMFESAMTIQTGIDGFRVVAERSGLYLGQDDAEYGKLDDSGHPTSAKVCVYKKGFERPICATAYWDEYVQKYENKVGTMWAKMPRLMLAKCAEALALRKAFPQDLSGIYTNEEMMQADTTNEKLPQIEAPKVGGATLSPETPQSPNLATPSPKNEAPMGQAWSSNDPISEKQIKFIRVLANEIDKSKEHTKLHAYIKQLFGKEKEEDLTKAEAKALIGGSKEFPEGKFNGKVFKGLKDLAEEKIEDKEEVPSVQVEDVHDRDNPMPEDFLK